MSLELLGRRRHHDGRQGLVEGPEVPSGGVGHPGLVLLLKDLARLR